MNGLWQLTRQSLVGDARRVGPHAVRCGLSLVLYSAVIAAHWNWTTTAAGLPLFRGQLLITALYVSALSIFGFSQSISEEKEEGTLGLMRLAGISPLAVILGKTVSRLIDAGLLLAVQLPFTIIAVTLGGVSMAQVFAAYGALAAYLWLLAAVGITFSTAAPTGAAAAHWTTGFVAAYALPPLMPRITSTGSVLIAIYEPVCLPLRFWDVTESAFNGPVWCGPVMFGWGLGTLLLVLSWAAFDRLAVNGGFAIPLWPRATSPRRPRHAWSRPIVWREFMFLGGGWRWFGLRIAAHLGILMSMQWIAEDLPFGFAWASLMSGLFALIDGTWTVTRMFHDELRDRTWSLLVLSQPLASRLDPHHGWIAEIVREKRRGWALGVAPSIVLPYVWIVLTILTRDLVGWEDRFALLIASLTVGVSVFANLQLIALLSLFFGWKSTPLAFAVCFGAAWIYLTAFVPWGSSVIVRCGIYAGTVVVLCGVMVGLEQRILKRLDLLAGEA